MRIYVYIEKHGWETLVLDDIDEEYASNIMNFMIRCGIAIKFYLATDGYGDIIPDYTSVPN